MSVIWVSCHMRANAVKKPDLEIGAMEYGCCVSCKGQVKFPGRTPPTTTKTVQGRPGARERRAK